MALRTAAPSVGVEEAPLAAASPVLSGEEPLLVAEGLPEEEAPEDVAAASNFKVPHSASRACSHSNRAAASEPLAVTHWSYQ